MNRTNSTLLFFSLIMSTLTLADNTLSPENKYGRMWQLNDPHLPFHGEVTINYEMKRGNNERSYSALLIDFNSPERAYSSTKTKLLISKSGKEGLRIHFGTNAPIYALDLCAKENKEDYTPCGFFKHYRHNRWIRIKLDERAPIPIYSL